MLIYIKILRRIDLKIALSEQQFNLFFFFENIWNTISFLVFWERNKKGKLGKNKLWLLLFFRKISTEAEYMQIIVICHLDLRSYDHFHNILRLFEVLPNPSFTTSETMLDYYLQTW